MGDSEDDCELAEPDSDAEAGAEVDSAELMLITEETLDACFLDQLSHWQSTIQTHAQCTGLG